jgi:hypothetical protein
VGVGTTRPGAAREQLSWQGLHVGWGAEAGKSGGRPSWEYFTYHAINIDS